MSHVRGVGGTGNAALWLLTLALLLLPRVLSIAGVMARGEAAGFGGVPRLVGGALLELLLSTLQAPLRMLAHCLFVAGALTGLKLEWKSPPRGALAPGWRDASRRIGTLVGLPLVAGLALLQRGAALALAPMLLPLTLAVPYVVLSGDPRAGRLARRLGLLRTPEDRRRPRPLQRVAECSAFDDLAPVPAAPPRPDAAPTSLRGLRHAPAFAMAAVAMLALSVPRSGIAPGLPPSGQAQPEWVAAADSAAFADSADPADPLPSSLDKPTPRKRVVWRERPARRIDDALRRRAIEAVERALAGHGAPA